jgi:hypothetical protein
LFLFDVHAHAAAHDRIGWCKDFALVECIDLAGTYTDDFPSNIALTLIALTSNALTIIFAPEGSAADFAVFDSIMNAIKHIYEVTEHTGHWVISLHRVRMHTKQNVEENGTLASYDNFLAEKRFGLAVSLPTNSRNDPKSILSHVCFVVVVVFMERVCHVCFCLWCVCMCIHLCLDGCVDVSFRIDFPPLHL